jgi:DNA-binding LacI/PurR family transcriptional regulator
MNKKITIAQVAELAMVSRSVVSRVLNNHPNVSDEARRRVQEVIERYNYRPSSVARSLSTDRTYEICVLAPRRGGDVLATGFWPLLHMAIFEECVSQGYFTSLMLISGSTNTEVVDRAISEKRFDGYILIAHEVTNLFLSKLSEREVPAVIIGSGLPEGRVCSVDVDNELGGMLAAQHLITRGRNKIGAILGNLSWKESSDRLAGFRRGLAESDGVGREAWVAEADYSQRGGFNVMTRHLLDHPAPDAVFCGSDSIAMGVMCALNRTGLRIPEDVAVVGFDDLPASEYTIPALSTVRQPIAEKGRYAAKAIIRLVEDDGFESEHMLLEPKLVVRGSS